MDVRETWHMHDNHLRNAFYKLILSNALCQSGKTDSERILRHPVRLVTSRTVRTRRPATSTRIRTRRRGATRASAWHPSASARRTEPRFQVENLYSPGRFHLVNSFPPILKYSMFTPLWWGCTVTCKNSARYPFAKAQTTYETFAASVVQNNVILRTWHACGLNSVFRTMCHSN